MMEALGMNFAIQRWRPFLWGVMFTVITDCCAHKWIETYEGDNAAVRRLQFGIIGYNFTCCHRLRHLNDDSDELSQLGINTLLGANITGSYSDNAVFI